MTERILICTDLDRTLLPNGVQPESPTARRWFEALAARPEVTVAYVTGRHRALIEQAINCYALPQPAYVIADVGTSIYQVTGKEWLAWDEWQTEIAPDWNGADNAALRQLFADLSALRLQEAAKQNTYKLSFYLSLQADRETLLENMRQRLAQRHIRASLIWSVDEPAGVGLLDVLPRGATKLHAVRFLMQHKGFTAEHSLFAGDSGNDLPVLTSELNAVLVANATDEVREAASTQAAAAGNAANLYLARGGFRNMNGNYSAGILEGVAHFMPQLANRIPEQ
ncbi:MAG: HAD-IIB family hydrolase [Gammaproteobacteria bacterium]|nr:HAD-IIB family hydrolase [Gammaproteobacteria bacterium]